MESAAMVDPQSAVSARGRAMREPGALDHHKTSVGDHMELKRFGSSVWASIDFECSGPVEHHDMVRRPALRDARMRCVCAVSSPNTHLVLVRILQSFSSAREVLIKSCGFNELLILISLNHFPHNGYYPAAD